MQKAAEVNNQIIAKLMKDHANTMEKMAEANDWYIATMKQDHVTAMEKITKVNDQRTKKLKKDHAEALEEAVEAQRESALEQDHVSWQLAKQKSALGITNAKFKKHRQQHEQTMYSETENIQ